MRRILAVVSSTSTLPSGRSTGYTLEELAAPYARFGEAGFEVDVASPSGGAVAHDPAYDSGPFLTEDGRRFLADETAKAKLSATPPLRALDASDYDGVFLVGGVAAAKDFDANPDLERLLERALSKGKVIGAVCHGVVGLSGVRTPGGDLAAKGEAMTGFSHDEEVAADLLAEVAVVPETRLRDVGADYRKAAEPWGVCVVKGAHFITGQNPASASATAEAMLKRLL